MGPPKLVDLLALMLPLKDFCSIWVVTLFFLISTTLINSLMRQSAVVMSTGPPMSVYPTYGELLS